MLRNYDVVDVYGPRNHPRVTVRDRRTGRKGTAAGRTTRIATRKAQAFVSGRGVKGKKGTWRYW